MERTYMYFTVTQDNEIITHEQFEPTFDLHQLQKEVGGFVEVVVPNILRYSMFRDVRMLCDDMGMYKENLRPNMLASALYAGETAILGNVVICSTNSTIPAEEPDIWPFTQYNGVSVKSFLERMMNDLKEHFPSGVQWEKI